MSGFAIFDILQLFLILIPLVIYSFVTFKHNVVLMADAVTKYALIAGSSILSIAFFMQLLPIFNGTD
jgi:hypothetical protein